MIVVPGPAAFVFYHKIVERKENGLYITLKQVLDKRKYNMAYGLMPYKHHAKVIPNIRKENMDI